MATPKKLKSIPLRGIVRNTPDEATQDGGLLEAINMRHKDGAWRGVTDKEPTGFQTQQSDVFGIPYHHPVLPDNIYVAHNVTDNTICTILFHATTNNSPVVHLTLANGEVFNRFSHMNNTLLVFTSVKKYMLYYNKDTGLYVDLSFIPVPVITVADVGSPESHEITIIGDATTEGAEDHPDYGYTDTQNYYEYFRQTVIGDLLKRKAEMNNDGCIEGFVIIRVAYKLFDGNYILASNPILHHIGYHPTKQPIMIVTNVGTEPLLHAEISQNYFATPIVYYNFFNTGTFTLPEHDQMGIIESIDIFSTRPVEAYDYQAPIIEWSEVTGASFSPPFNVDRLKEMLEDGQYYKVHSIPIKDIISQEGGYYSTKAGSALPDYSKDVAANELLPPDNFTHHTYNSLADKTYNSRIHLGSIINTLSPALDNNFISLPIVQIGPGWGGYGQSYDTFNMTAIRDKFLSTYITPTGLSNSGVKFYQQVWLNTTQGRKVVTTELSQDYVATFDGSNIPATFNYYLYTDGTHKALILNPILSYPDYRAYKMRYYYVYNNVKYFLRDFDLKANTALNIGMYVNPITLTDGSTGNHYPIRILIPDSLGSGEAMPTDNPATDDILTDYNRVQVSEQSNPFFWPAKNSYRFGNSENSVIAISGVQSAMSDSAFGQYPLYIFTQSGVFALQTGNGEVLYQNIQHINNEKLLSKDAQVDISGAIVFACKEGIRIIQGDKTEELSIPVEGSITNPLINDSNYLYAISGYNLPAMVNYLSNITFSAYITNCKLFFDIENKELIVSSQDSGILYSYVYSFYTKVWTTRTEVFNGSMIVNGRMIGIKSFGVETGTPPEPTTVYSYTGEFITIPYSSFFCQKVLGVNNGIKRSLNILIKKYATTGGVTTEVTTGFPKAEDGKQAFSGERAISQSTFDNLSTLAFHDRADLFKGYIEYLYPGIAITWTDSEVEDLTACPLPLPPVTLSIVNPESIGTDVKIFDIVTSDLSTKTVNYELFVDKIDSRLARLRAVWLGTTSIVSATSGASTSLQTGSITIHGTIHVEIDITGVANIDTNILDCKGYIRFDYNDTLKQKVLLYETPS